MLFGSIETVVKLKMRTTDRQKTTIASIQKGSWPMHKRGNCTNNTGTL